MPAPVPSRQPAIEGWFTRDGDPRLLGTRCRACGAVFFPKETFACRNPNCGSDALEELPLSDRGTLWSFTDNRYPPPPPFVASDPFEPYAIAAVELAAEKLVVLGQVAKGVTTEQLTVGMEMELIVEALFEDESGIHEIWKWRPA
jgi:uncharacterized OB-fold protein